MTKQNWNESTTNTSYLFRLYTNSHICVDNSNRLLVPIYSKKMPSVLSDQFDFVGDKKLCYLFSKRINYNFTVYHSEMYTRCKKSCDYILRFNYLNSEENFGVIKEFFEVEKELYVVLNTYKVSVYDFFANFHINNRKVLDDFDFTKFYYKISERSNEQIVVKMSSVISKCVLVAVNGTSYLTDFLYDREHD